MLFDVLNSLENPISIIFMNTNKNPTTCTGIWILVISTGRMFQHEWFISEAFFIYSVYSFESYFSLNVNIHNKGNEYLVIDHINWNLLSELHHYLEGS